MAQTCLDMSNKAARWSVHVSVCFQVVVVFDTETVKWTRPDIYLVILFNHSNLAGWRINTLDSQNVGRITTGGM